MRPETCKNCDAHEFIELEDAYVCTYCDSRFPKTPVRELTEIRYVEVPVPTPVPETKVQITPNGKPKNKWVAFFLCLFLGFYGAHKFYEGRIGMGILYLFTAGLFGFGWIVDCVRLLTKPNPYYIA